ncbi:aldehyde reductase [Limnobacter humi]|uniref:Aldehyde reductase n=1 Tax=Limnobacter humi TaxID=1778671 RepID=A0ABT1WGH7_9BURK|nr:aldehyde reductase [Limnobacter humi]MCQ8896625.1 aldehyde reductase [Limnobacter humi]
MVGRAIDRSKPVCITGASGYIASWIVLYLLADGLTVHATVRDARKASSVDHLLKAAQGQPGVLKLFSADLIEEGSFDEAVRGCELVIHTASPFIIKGFKDPYEALVRPAVDGTRNVLESCNRSGSVRRVVLTSSVASIYGDAIEALSKRGHVFTEADWNETSSESHQPYSYSKVMAERKAWEINKAQSAWDLVTINPSLVVGPSLTRNTQSTSIDVMRDLGSGRQKTGVPHLEFALVDVREVARAHVLAGFNPDAQGRFIVSGPVVSLLQMANVLRGRFPQYPLPTRELPKWLVRWVAPIAAGVSRAFIDQNVGYSFSFDNTRSQSVLGIQYRLLTDTLCEHFEQPIEDGLLRRR